MNKEYKRGLEDALKVVETLAPIYEQHLKGVKKDLELTAHYNSMVEGVKGAAKRIEKKLYDVEDESKGLRRAYEIAMDQVQHYDRLLRKVEGDSDAAESYRSMLAGAEGVAKHIKIELPELEKDPVRLAEAERLLGQISKCFPGCISEELRCAASTYEGKNTTTADRDLIKGIRTRADDIEAYLTKYGKKT